MIKEGQQEMILPLGSTSQREIPLVRGLENSWANMLLSDVRNDMEEGTRKRVHGRGYMEEGALSRR